MKGERPGNVTLQAYCCWNNYGQFHHRNDDVKHISNEGSEEMAETAYVKER